MTKQTDPLDELVADTTRGYEGVASPAMLRAARAALRDVFASDPVMKALIAEDLPRDAPDESGENARDPKMLAEIAERKRKHGR